MSRLQRKLGRSAPAATFTASSQARSTIPRRMQWQGVSVAVGLTTVALAWGYSTRQRANTSVIGASGQRQNDDSYVTTPNSYQDLLAMSAAELEKVDIAAMNLLCAKGLPGAENLDVRATLATLDDWAARVGRDTERYHPRFLQNPAANNNSEADFRMLSLITVLQLDLGVRYNPSRIDAPDFRNSKDLFIHGMVASDNGGTCVSMPVLYVAVGRRLGYPLKLVLAREHTFVRWEGKGERLNIEGSGRGMNTFPDEHYRAWPKPIKEEWVESGEFLRSLTAEEALADFLATRGHCLNDLTRLDEAAECYQAAARLNPRVQAYSYFIAANKALMTQKQSNGNVPLRLPSDPYSQ